MSGEMLLCLRVFEAARDDLLRYAHGVGRRERRLFREAGEWFADPSGEWIYSFRSICDLLGWESDWVLKGIRREVALSKPGGMKKLVVRHVRTLTLKMGK